MGIVTRTLANNLTTGLAGDKKGTPIIVNGDMAVAQRGASSTSDGIATCDRWNVRKTNLDNLALTQAQSTTVPGHGFKHSFKYDTTTIETALASDEKLAIETRLEANTMQALKYGTAQAEATTLTFWAKSSLTGVHGIYIRTHDGAQEFVQSYTIATADTWQKVAINIPANTAKVINNDNGIGWWIQWILAAGTGVDGATLGSWHDNATEIAPTSQVNLMANTSYEFCLTGVQLEIGTFTADTTPAFPFESYGDNIARCKRYFQSPTYAEDEFGTSEQYGTFGAGTYTASGYFRCARPLDVEMRSNPTLSASSGSNHFFIGSGANDYVDDLTIHADSNFKTAFVYNSDEAGGTAGQCGNLMGNHTDAFIHLVAEL